MSFRGRLRLFFAIIVIVPMVAVAVVMLMLTQRSETGKADAGISKGTDVAFSVYRESVARARPPLRSAASDPRLAGALTAGREAAARKRMRELVRSGPAVAIVLKSETGSFRAQAGAPEDAVAFARVPLVRRNGDRVGTLQESVTSARAYARRVATLTDLDVVLQRGGSTLATTLPGSKDVSSGSETVKVDGRDFRVHASRIREANGGTTTVAVLYEASGLEDAIGASRLVVIGIVLAFLLFALAFSLQVVRGLHGQVGQFLEAARRIGRGDFAQGVPVTGSDEFADLGREFNSMSEQLKSKIEEVEHKRRELEETIRRVGQAFASGLDPQGVVELAVQTAIDACAADAGRALSGDAFPLRELQVGAQGPEPRAALDAAERAARDEHGEAKLGLTAAERGGVYALAVPLLARLGTATRTSDVGVISIARRHRPFTHSDEQLLEYLAGQAVVSIENADLHETVQQQAITDELTGLSNVRELQAALNQEIERGRRFDTAVGFVMLDLDDFKQINDLYGHPQGDDVLVAVARVVRGLSRDIDQPARYGGEELAVILPETALAGAALLAGRMRAAIEQLRVPVRGTKSVLRVTASFGVASIPECAHDRGSLIGAADAALYRAKRAGKNRVERAEAVHASR